MTETTSKTIEMTTKTSKDKHEDEQAAAKTSETTAKKTSDSKTSEATVNAASTVTLTKPTSVNRTPAFRVRAELTLIASPTIMAFATQATTRRICDCDMECER